MLNTMNHLEVKRTSIQVFSHPNDMTAAQDASVSPPEAPILPLACEYDEGSRTFRVTHISKEKTIAAGGFGYLANSQQFLFLEDVIFLCERGLLEVHNKHGSSHQKMHLAGLHRLLAFEPDQISFPVYLAYQHLRAQTYRVVRHTSTRQSIIQAMEQRLQQLKLQDNQSEQPIFCESPRRDSIPEISNQHDNTEQDMPTTTITKSFWRKDDELLRLRKLLRLDAAKAQPPQLEREIAWDCYNPNSQFSSTHPGLPDFQVVVVTFVGSSLTFELLHALAQIARQCCSDETFIPLKVAAVSDSGTVVLLGISDHGVPAILHVNA